MHRRVVDLPISVEGEPFFKETHLSDKEREVLKKYCIALTEISRKSNRISCEDVWNIFRYLSILKKNIPELDLEGSVDTGELKGRMVKFLEDPEILGMISMRNVITSAGNENKGKLAEGLLPQAAALDNLERKRLKIDLLIVDVVNYFKENEL